MLVATDAYCVLASVRCHDESYCECSALFVHSGLEKWKLALVPLNSYAILNPDGRGEGEGKGEGVRVSAPAMPVHVRPIVEAANVSSASVHVAAQPPEAAIARTASQLVGLFWHVATHKGNPGLGLGKRDAHDGVAAAVATAAAVPLARAAAEPPAAMTSQKHDKVSAPDTLPVAGIALDK